MYVVCDLIVTVVRKLSDLPTNELRARRESYEPEAINKPIMNMKIIAYHFPQSLEFVKPSIYFAWGAIHRKACNGESLSWHGALVTVKLVKNTCLT